MKRCTIIGKTNVGKTLFFINFAEYLGVKFLVVEFINHEGIKTTQKIYSKSAISELIDNKIHKTRGIQSLYIDVPIGKGKKKIKMVDTVGLIDGIHPDINMRKAISQTLSIIRESDIILHLIDASATVDKDLPNALGEIDYQIAQFGQLKRGYAILANKMDLTGSELGLNKIKQEFAGNLIIPISALYKKGFKEVKTFVGYNI